MARRFVQRGSRPWSIWLDDLTKVTHGLSIVLGRQHEVKLPEDIQKPKKRKIVVSEDAVKAGKLYDEYLQKRAAPVERKVPATPLERIAGFSGVAAKLAFGTVGDLAQRAVGGGGEGSSIMSPANAERLAAGLCRMRGAALKIGQMLSIQDNALVSPELTAMLETVRQGADVMPSWQLEKMLATEWGENWESKFQEFDRKPIAAASLGQVHRAILADGKEVAVKVQYPGVAESIDSDINNLATLIRVLNLAPKGLYIEKVMEEGRLELKRECDYVKEATFQERFRALIGNDDPVLFVPAVHKEFSTSRVLVSDFVHGIPIDKLAEFGVDQETRNQVAETVLEMCLRELFEFRFMQTDPNWSNFLFDPKTGRVQLLDFGASREFSRDFVENYLHMVMACASRDRDEIIRRSIALGFLNGTESESMLNAQAEAGFLVGEPFTTEEPYDFVEGNISGRIAGFARTMLKERKQPPPTEVYTLHRKLSGAFLTCTKLSAVVQCRAPFLRIYNAFIAEGLKKQET